MAQGKGGGRPKFNIDYETAETMATFMCTIEEIAAELGCSHDTLSRDEKFCVVYKKGIEKAKASLRAKQFKLAEINPTMSIWLGKQYLQQTDKQEITSTATNTNINIDADISKFMANATAEEKARAADGYMTMKEQMEIINRK